MENKIKLNDQDSFVTCYLRDQEVEVRIGEIEILPFDKGDLDFEVELRESETFDGAITVCLTLSPNALKFLTDRYNKTKKA